MNRPVDRGEDPSPFAWIFAGALALIGVGSLLRARRQRREDTLVAEESADESAEATAEGHPS